MSATSLASGAGVGFMTDVSFVLCLAAFSFFLHFRATADLTFRKGAQLGQKRCLCERKLLDEFPVEHVSDLPAQRIHLLQPRNPVVEKVLGTQTEEHEMAGALPSLGQSSARTG